MSQLPFSKIKVILMYFLLGILVIILCIFYNEGNVYAVPSFARQTGFACAECHIHAFGVALTPLGREFKLNGYILGESNRTYPPLAAMAIGSFTHTNAGQHNVATPGYGANNNFALDQMSLFYAGQVFWKIGAFVQMTYDGVAKHLSIDNADIRLANQKIIGGREVLYGISLNNNPTAQDLWNTTPAWWFPEVSSPVSPQPAAATLIDGGLSQQVWGLSAYTMWNQMLYLELGFYRSLSKRAEEMVGIFPDTEYDIHGLAPYWRLTFQREWGGKYFSIGTYGLQAKVYPNRQKGAGTDRYTDIGFDMSYQFLCTKRHIVSINATYIREHQSLRASSTLGTANNYSNKLRTFRTDMSYTFVQTVGVTASYFRTTGTPDSGVYPPDPISGSKSGSPDSTGYILEFDYIPFGKEKSFLFPWLNARFGLQYVGYIKFNGSGANYDGLGRNAKDNDTIYLFAWFAI